MAFEQAIAPDDCMILFALPITKNDFLRHRNTKPDSNKCRDFIPRMIPYLVKYEKQIITPIKKVLPWFKQWGVNVVENATLADFHRATYLSKIKVVILFSHWTQNCAEFDDGLWSVPEIVNGISIDFNGYIDLTICHPIGLALTIRRERPSVLLTKYVTKQAYTDIWMNYFFIVFKILKCRQETYLSASTQAAKLFLNGRRD
jgi:hypothetical protein